MMKSITSYFKISPALIREDFRRYWIIPAVAAIAYFLTAVFPILMAYDDLEASGMANYIRTLLSNQNPMMLMFHVALPIITAVTLYRYMHNIGSTAVVHAMPFTRSGLFNSHLVSGLCMSIVPTVLCGVILLLISKPVFSQGSVAYYSASMSIVGSVINTPESINVFARGDVFSWMWQSVLIVAVIYFTSSFVASITGNSIIQMVTSGIFVCLVPSFLGVLIVYFNQFLFGYSTSDAYVDFLQGLCPLLQPFRTENEAFTIGWVIFYLLCVIVLFFLGHFLYRRKKLERATESFTYKPIAVFMSYIAAFFGMTLFGFYFYALGGDTAFMYLGFAAGAALIFFIAELIIGRSWYIFSRGTAKKLGVYAVIAIVFLAGLNFDVTGYEKRIPDSSRISSVFIDQQLFNSILYNDFGYNTKENRLELKSPENINATLNLHESLTQLRNIEDQTPSGQKTYFHLDYTLSNGNSLSRQYYASMWDFLINSPDMKTIMQSQEYKSLINAANLSYADKNSKDITPLSFSQITLFASSASARSLSPQEQKAFYQCFKDDLYSRSFEDMIMPKGPFIDVHFSLSASESMLRQYGYYSGASSINCAIDSSFKKSIAWLRENNYYDEFMIDLDNAVYVTIDRIKHDENGYIIYSDVPVAKEMEYYGGSVHDYSAVQYGVDKLDLISETPPANTADRMVITDKQEIDKVIHSYCSEYAASALQNACSYQVKIYIKDPDVMQDGSPSMSYIGGYYFDNTIPPEFASYFK